MQSDLFHCKVTLHVSGVTAPIIRILKTVIAASGTGHNIGTASSLQRGQIGTLEGTSCTDIMTGTRGCGYSFYYPDDGCCDT